MDLDLPVILGIGYFILSLFGGAVKKRRAEQARAAGSRSMQQVGGAPVAVAERKRPQTMQDLLEEMQAQMERAAQPEEQGDDGYTDQDADADEPEFTTIETAPEVVSLDVPRTRVDRVEASADDSVEALVLRRIEAANARNRAWRPEDHRRFDETIRRVDPVAVRGMPDAVARLRQAVVWREILGAPVGWPDRDGR